MKQTKGKKKRNLLRTEIKIDRSYEVVRITGKAFLTKQLCIIFYF